MKELPGKRIQEAVPFSYYLITISHALSGLINILQLFEIIKLLSIFS